MATKHPHCKIPRPASRPLETLTKIAAQNLDGYLFSTYLLSRTVVPHNQADGCLMSMTFATEEAIPQPIIDEWQGTVLWRSTKNPYRPGHKRSNWFVGINFFDEVELPHIDESDIIYETCRSGGKGGQNVNKVETAVRATHISTGLSVKCSDERSQSQNKSLARERLLLKLREINEKTLADSQTRQWNNHDNLERGNPIKKFSGPL